MRACILLKVKKNLRERQTFRFFETKIKYGLAKIVNVIGFGKFVVRLRKLLRKSRDESNKTKRTSHDSLPYSGVEFHRGLVLYENVFTFKMKMARAALARVSSDRDFRAELLFWIFFCRF